MLEIRPSCEHCGKSLPNESTEAMICTFECTYCKQCALQIFENVCPNCTGNFTKRPIRPKAEITNHPPSKKEVYKPKNLDELRIQIEKYKNVAPEKR